MQNNLILSLIAAFEAEPNLLANSESVDFHTNGTMTIKEISKDHEGLYQCVISNGVGPELKKDIHIKVIGEFAVYKYLKGYLYNNKSIFFNYFVLTFFLSKKYSRKSRKSALTTPDA